MHIRLQHLFLLVLISIYAAAVVFVAHVHVVRPLRPDPDLVEGQLPNGMHYVIEPNHNQPGEVSLWLHMAVGSTDEKPGEEGMAHFLEHMAFNGTTSFTAQELNDRFRAMGLTLGVHQDAFTTFNQTTFQLNLPKADAAQIETVLRYLSEVGDGMTLAPDKIESEKKVVLQEIRARSDSHQRLMCQLFASWFGDTRAGDHAILGSDATVQAFTADALRAFYERNYRPDKATVIITGDIDPQRALALLKADFSSWPADSSVATTNEPPINLPTAPKTSILTDVEDKDAEVMISAITPQPSIVTEETFRTSVMRKIAASILQQRFSTLRETKSEPYFQDMAISTDMFQICETDLVSLESDPAHWRETAETAARELRRVDEYGFLQQEVDEAKAALLAQVKQAAAGEAKTHARDLAMRLNDDLSTKSTCLSPAQVSALLDKIAPTVSAQDVAAQFRHDYDPAHRLVSIVLPKTAGTAPPTEAEVDRVLATTENEKLGPWQEQALAAGFLTKVPAPAHVPALSVEASGRIETAALTNGVVLHHRSMDVADNQILLQLTLGGGTLEETANNRGITQLIAQALNEPATASLPAGELQRLLASKSITLHARADADAVSVLVATTPAHVEDAFQLIHLLLTSVRIDPAALDNWKRSAEANLQEEELDPMTRGLWQLQSELFGGDERWQPLTAANIQRIDLTGARAWADHLLVHAPLEIAVVGQLPATDLTNLTARYLATLPKREPLDSPVLARLRKITPVTGPVVVHVDVPAVSPKAVVTIGFRGVDAHLTHDALGLRLLASILTERLKQKLRIDDGLTYSIQVESTPANAYPDTGLFLVRFTCDPAKTEAASQECLEVIDDLARTGPTDLELSDAAAQIRNQIDVDNRSPQYWLARLARLDFGGSHLNELLGLDDKLSTFTRTADLRSLAQHYFAPQRQIVVTSGPAPITALTSTTNP